MDAVRKNYLALGLLSVSNKHNGCGCPKFYVAIEHKYFWKYSTGDYAKFRRLIHWKNNENGIDFPVPHMLITTT
jgi:hypothetical protein